MKTVSVIIPCYRDSVTLERAIKSVLAQSYPAIEIIVVNDCSPESEDINCIVARYPKIRYLCNEINLGLAASRNAGIAAASGDYIALLDADDEYHPEKISHQMKEMEPGIAVTCGWLNVELDGCKTVSRLASQGIRVYRNLDQIIFRNTLNGAGLLIERSLFLSLGGYDSSLRSCEDFDFWLRLLENKILIKDIGDPLYLYYNNPYGLSKDFLNISKWEAETIRRHSLRSGKSWSHSMRGMLVCLVWISRQLIRFELRPSPQLADQIMNNIDLFDLPDFLNWSMRVFKKSRLFLLPAVFIYFRKKIFAS